MAIDETSLSNGEIYTILTNRDRHGRERCLAAVVRGTRSEDVINALEHIPEDILGTVEEVLWTCPIQCVRLSDGAFRMQRG
jgi:hypothetical protein